MAIKLDLEKAYDKVEWVTIYRILSLMGCSPHFISLIQSCLSTVSFVVLVNVGEQSFRCYFRQCLIDFDLNFRMTSCKKFIVHLKDYEYAIGTVNPIGYTLEKLKNDLKIHALREGIPPPLYPLIKFQSPSLHELFEIANDDDLSYMMELFVDDEVHLYIHDSDDKSKPLIDEDLCDDAQAFFDEVDSIIYRSQHGSSSKLRIDDRAFDIGLDANLSDGLSAQENNLGEGGCTDDVSTNDDWHSNEGEEVNNDESETDDLGQLTYPIEDNTDDSDGYEPNLKDKWHIDVVDNEHDFEVPAYLKGKFFEYNKDGSVTLEVGLMFYDKGWFLEALTDYAVFNGFDMLRFKHSRQRFRACCSSNF
ncbi:hypothetical protein Ancab_035012 [Ancistrocladus abbreviatus]